MELVQTLQRFGSVARPVQLLRAGFSERDLRNAVNDGVVRRERPGVLALPGADPVLRYAVVANGLVSCVSAAHFYGFWVLHNPELPHLLCRHGGEKNAVVHRNSVVPKHPLLPVAGKGDVLIHALNCRPVLEAVVMVESAVAQGESTLDFLRERLPGKRNGKARSVLDLVECTADSPLEVVARLLFRKAGLFVQAQVEIAGVGIVDFLIEGFLIIEVDGKTHLEPKQVIKDRARNNASILRGYTVLRFDYAALMYRPEEVLAQVQQVLAGRVIR
ncbi:endonuclease domain-containing protein [Pseudarthrobacter sp. J1738]|uniref:endonuclease domain-containing protein n=1 Tax=Pseudarthrobacter sp. J1738 TaxID=3420446 RepID=UPI003D2981C4